MIYGSVCSGIEAATVAWHPLGWRPSFLAEIDAFPSAVLAHHYPNVPNLGDFTTITPEQHEPIDLLVGGTPCQSFSLAGLRGGLADDRGNLALEYLRLAQRARPRWLVWENVPGVLSSNGGRDFGAILGGMGELGYGFAYRVLDAQYIRVDGFPRAVPQRRRRVFAVGYLGDWRRAAAVLFERASLLGHHPPSRSARQTIAPPLAARTRSGGGLGTDFEVDGGLIETIAPDVMQHAITAKLHKGTSGPAGDEHHNLIAHSLRAEGYDASEDGSGRGIPLVPAVAFDSKASGSRDFSVAEEIAPTLRGMSHAESHANAGGQIAVAQSYAVRRLTPLECERLQGFPDNYTNIPWRGQKHAADGPRYKALGNSMAVNAMRWIGRRIELVELITRQMEAA